LGIVGSVHTGALFVDSAAATFGGDIYCPAANKIVELTGPYLRNITLDTTTGEKIAVSGNWDIGAYELRALKFYSDQATGTAPLTVLSTTKCANLNCDQVDGKEPGVGVGDIAYYDANTRVVDSDKVDGYNAAEAATASTVAARDASGYLLATGIGAGATPTGAGDVLANRYLGTNAGRIYFSATHYLYLSGNDIYWYNGSTGVKLN